MRKAVLLVVLLVLCFVTAVPVFAQGRGERRAPPNTQGRAVPRTQPRVLPQPRVQPRPQVRPRQYVQPRFYQRQEPRFGFGFQFSYPYPQPYYRGGYYPYYRPYYQPPQVIYVPDQWVWDNYYRQLVWIPAHYERIY